MNQQEKPRIEHCPNGCFNGKWHYRVKAGRYYPFWGTWLDCVNYLFYPNDPNLTRWKPVLEGIRHNNA